jgi:SAM-dependent methyltransferase
MLSLYLNIQGIKENLSMSSDITIPDEAVKYILFQRTAHLAYPKFRSLRMLKKMCPWSLYETYVTVESVLRRKKVKQLFNQTMVDEFKNIESYLPGECSRILDIGCGVGGMSVMLHRHYGGGNVEFYLLDKTDLPKKVYYGFQRKAAFYNSLEMTRKILCDNGIKREKIHLLEVPDDYMINVEASMDFVISLWSWGFHYPVSRYIDQVHNILRRGGRLILDIRKQSEGDKQLAGIFSKIEKISESKKGVRFLAIK